MIFEKCVKLKKLIVKYNRKRVDDDNFLRYEFGMFEDGEWSCTIRCSGCVDVHDFKEIYDFISTLFVAPFMYGSSRGFRVHVQ